MIIDCHGHYTTAPAALQTFREQQIAGLKGGIDIPLFALPKISDDQIRDSLENAQLKLQRARDTDLTIFSPRASAMAHHIGNETTSRRWTQACNDLNPDPSGGHWTSPPLTDRHWYIGSEMVGAVRGIDPETGQYFDDTKRYVDALALSDADRHKIFEGNARRVFPRLDARLAR
jgi:hypothetical protein